jgi:hypothetical protein
VGVKEKGVNKKWYSLKKKKELNANKPAKGC